MPDDTVHILNSATFAANQMMVVVADPCFIKCRSVGGFDASYQSHFQQGMKVIVNGLMGKAAEAFTRNGGNGIGAEMPAAIDCLQHRETG